MRLPFVVLVLMLGLCLPAFAAARWWHPVDAGAGITVDAAGGLEPGGPFRASGQLAVRDDPFLGRAVLECGEQPVALQATSPCRNVEIRCLARLATTAQRPDATLAVSLRDPADVARDMTVSLAGRYDGDLTVTAFGVNRVYALRAYKTIMPTWPDAVRAPIERDMSALPWSQDKWVQVRWLLTDACMRIWIDDRLLVDTADGYRPTGLLQLALPPGARLAALTVQPAISLPARFEPIGLDGYARDRALSGMAAVADAALPLGRTVEVDGLPFRFADRRTTGGADHIDVGRSLCRQGQLDGYFPTYEARYSGCWTVDPARIQLRVPNARYDAMYVIAGCSGAPATVPVLSAMFYRPGCGFSMCFTSRVPAVAAAAAQNATPLGVTLENGKRVNLWLVRIPLDPGRLSSFADLPIVEVELTKQVRQYRSYPDPFLYGWHGAGLPSGVQVYAVTLHKPEVDMRLDPAVFGHVWTAPQTPSYTVTLTNRGPRPRHVTLMAATASNDGSERHRWARAATVAAGGTATVAVDLPVAKNGTHTLRLTLRDGQAGWTEERNFCRLAPDTRAPYWKAGDGPLFGFWTYGSGHDGPPTVEVYRVMQAAGARTTIASNASPKYPEGQFILDHKWALCSNGWPVTPQWEWAATEPLDMTKYTAYGDAAVKAIRPLQCTPEDFVTFFPEPSIGLEVSHGIPRDYYGDVDPPLTATERKNLAVYFNTARAAADGVRAAWPTAKILIPWGDPLFPVALLRAGYPRELIDGTGLDMIGFERLPEQQIAQQSTHRLYVLTQEFKKAGIARPALYYTEGIFSPTEAGALTWQEQAERYHRWSLISLAYGVERFYSGWFAYDCGDGYGAEHYGGCGIQRRIPYLDPKPAYAHYATMTRHLERSTFERWLPTGSLTVYCLQFRRLGQPVYALWTIRGARPVTVTLARDAAFTLTDSMDNGRTVTTIGGRATFTVGTAPVYLDGAVEITRLDLGAPDHRDAIPWARARNQQTWHDGPAEKPAPVQKVLAIADFGDGGWTATAERDALYETNNFDVKRFPGHMTTMHTTDAERKGAFLAVHLGKQDVERRLMPWYTVLAPKAPVVIPGKAAALGVWVKADSDWGRIVYSLRDAKGERWISIGTRDQWNCNDIHGWTSFCFDGWRYLRMELPGNADYDAFREVGTTWWGCYHGDGVVDLPLTLEKVIVERRTHVLYVNDIQPANPEDVLLGALTAEYETPVDATPQAVALNRLRLPAAGPTALPNPIAAMADNALTPVTLTGIRPPDWGYDGTTGLVEFTETPAAAAYQVWVAAYPDGRGAVALGQFAKSGQQLYNLRPAMPLYLWVTYTTADNRQSRPSNRLDVEMVDAFGQK